MIILVLINDIVDELLENEVIVDDDEVELEEYDEIEVVEAEMVEIDEFENVVVWVEFVVGILDDEVEVMVELDDNDEVDLEGILVMLNIIDEVVVDMAEKGINE